MHSQITWSWEIWLSSASFSSWDIASNTIVSYVIALKVPQGHYCLVPTSQTCQLFSFFHSHSFLPPHVPLPFTKLLVAKTSLMVSDPLRQASWSP